MRTVRLAMGQCGGSREKDAGPSGRSGGDPFPFPAVVEDTSDDTREKAGAAVPEPPRTPPNVSVEPPPEVAAPVPPRSPAAWLNKSSPQDDAWALLLLESGAQGTFDWVKIDFEGNQVDALGLSCEPKSAGGKSKVGKRARFERLSTVLAPEKISWSMPLHYVCIHAFPDHTPEEVFDALYDIEKRSSWEESFKNATILEKVAAENQGGFEQDVVYSCFPNENKVMRLMGLNFDFVDERTCFKNACFPPMSMVPKAYWVATQASRQTSHSSAIYEAIRSDSFRLRFPEKGQDGEKPNQAPAAAAARRSNSVSVPSGETINPDKFKRIQPLPPAQYVVVLRPLPESHPLTPPKRRGFDRCESVPPSGYVIRSWSQVDDRDVSSCLVRQPLGSGKGARLTIVSRSSIQVPVNGMVTRKRLHIQTMKQFCQWRTRLEDYLNANNSSK